MVYLANPIALIFSALWVQRRRQVNPVEQCRSPLRPTPSAVLGNSTLGDIYKRLLLLGGENAILCCSENGNALMKGIL
jgi:hypothetical protein